MSLGDAPRCTAFIRHAVRNLFSHVGTLPRIKTRRTCWDARGTLSGRRIVGKSLAVRVVGALDILFAAFVESQSTRVGISAEARKAEFEKLDRSRSTTTSAAIGLEPGKATRRWCRFEMCPPFAERRGLIGVQTVANGLAAANGRDFALEIACGRDVGPRVATTCLKARGAEAEQDAQNGVRGVDWERHGETLAYRRTDWDGVYGVAYCTRSGFLPGRSRRRPSRR